MEGLVVRTHAVDNVPSLDAVANAWRVALTEHFAHVSVAVVECPDLRVPDWGLAAASITGNVEIIDVGGPLNVERADKRDRLVTSFEALGTLIGRRPDAFYWGAGATATSVVGRNAELMPNAYTGPTAAARICTHFTHTVAPTSSGAPLSFATLPYGSNVFANLCNAGVADGAPGGQVVAVDVSVRRGATNFVDVLCQALAVAHPQHQVSVCGVFRIEQGAVRAHVMPPFPACDLPTSADVQAWLQFFPMDAPLVCMSVFHSRDEHGVGLRMQHTHFFSQHGHGGHYHYDTTPDTVRYRGYFSLAQRVHKIDAP